MKIDNNLDANRLEGVPGMAVERCETPNMYKVYGAGRPHVVELDYERGFCDCDCSDFVYRGIACRHVIAARWFCGDTFVVGKLGPMSAHSPVAGVRVDSPVRSGGSGLKNGVTDDRHWFYPLAAMLESYVCTLASPVKGANAILVAEMIKKGVIHLRYLDSKSEQKGFAIAVEDITPDEGEVVGGSEAWERARIETIENIYTYVVSQLKDGAFADWLTVYRTSHQADLGYRDDVVWSGNRTHRWTVNKTVVGVELAVKRERQWKTNQGDKVHG